jgi:hypothetical protein
MLLEGKDVIKTPNIIEIKNTNIPNNRLCTIVLDNNFPK